MGNRFLDWLLGAWRELFGAHVVSSSTCPPFNWNQTKGGVWYMGSPQHRAWQSTALANSDVWGRLFKEVSGNEGSSSAYQNYDNQKVTLGAGFGARGMLGSVAKNLGRQDIVPLPDNGNKYSGELLARMSDAETFGRQYVCKAESLALRDAVLQAQIATFKNSKARYEFPVDNFPLLYLLSHLAHWYPAFVPVGGWTGNDSVDVPRVLREFRAAAANWKPSITPSETQIGHYITKYRKLGGTHAP